MIAPVCPRCKSQLQSISVDELRCSQDDLTFRKVDGIWRFLLPEREETYARFIRDYEAVRRFEGRGSADESYYQTLPYHPTRDWKIRAASFDAFIKQVLVPIENTGKHLRIVDMGAGNGWLSNRLTSRGHEVASIDLTVNDFDGLGCHRFYESTFTLVQAEFDYLPFPNRSVDMILFNASLHYTVNYEQTLLETSRALNADGKLVVLDSPIYRDAGSGSRMVREREEQFTKRYGFPSNHLQSENYLTYSRLQELARKLNLEWKFITPFYSIQWQLRPVIARLLGRREPANFHVIVGEAGLDAYRHGAIPRE
jgi:ubiquinone/menaquinone biosynthesis C-methylase UbiE